MTKNVRRRTSPESAGQSRVVALPRPSQRSPLSSQLCRPAGVQVILTLRIVHVDLGRQLALVLRR